jgi:hypothetical protein
MYNDPPGVSPITINGDVIESLEHERGRIYVAQASGKILTLDAENVIYYEPFENSGTDTSAKDDSAKAES